MRSTLAFLVGAILSCLVTTAVLFFAWTPSPLSPEGLIALASGLLTQQELELRAEYEAEQAVLEGDLQILRAHLAAADSAAAAATQRAQEADAAASISERDLGRTVQLALQREAELRAQILAAAPEVGDALEELEQEHRGVAQGFRVRLGDYAEQLAARDVLIVDMRRQLSIAQRVIETMQSRLDLAEDRIDYLGDRRVRIQPAIMLFGVDRGGTMTWPASPVLGLVLTW